MSRIRYTAVLAILTLSVVACHRKENPDRVTVPSIENVRQEDDPKRHYEKSGGFSFIPPENWKVREMPGFKYKLIVGPIRDKFASNLCLTDEAFAGTLKEYEEISLTNLPKMLKSFRLLKREEFKTDHGLPGVLLQIENEQETFKLRQSQCIFKNNQTMYTFTGSTLANEGEKLDQVFVACMRTFRFEPK